MFEQCCGVVLCGSGFALPLSTTNERERKGSMEKNRQTIVREGRLSVESVSMFPLLPPPALFSSPSFSLLLLSLFLSFAHSLTHTKHAHTHTHTVLNLYCMTFSCLSLSASACLLSSKNSPPITSGVLQLPLWALGLARGCQRWA